MTPEVLRLHLTAGAPVSDTLQFLHGVLIPAFVERLNIPEVRRKMALYGGERVPENQTNLTDVRNRISLLTEYTLGWVANEVLLDAGVHDIFWTNVVANRFPDIEVRRASGERGVRIEIKCIEAVAEEPAANFDTLKKDLHPDTDYVLVFVWEWCSDVVAGHQWDKAPKVVGSFVFHARSLASLRDWKWLNAPPTTLGDGVQGIDMRYAVTCVHGIYKKEGDNYGKILRVWDAGLPLPVDADASMKTTAERHKHLREFARWQGFSFYARDLLNEFSVTDAYDLYDAENRVVGRGSAELAVVYGPRFPKKGNRPDPAFAQAAKRLVNFTQNFSWTLYDLNGSLKKILSGDKPYKLFNYLREN